MRSVATDKLNLQSLPAAARQCHKFEHMPTPLLSVKTFCGNDLDVLFQHGKVTVTNAGGSTVLEGELDPRTDLYMVPLNDKPMAVPSQGGGPAKAMATKEVNNTRDQADNTKAIAQEVNM